MKISTLGFLGLIGLFSMTELSPAADWEDLNQLVKRQQGESRWMEIDWYPSVWEGRKMAAMEGKPIFFMAGSGGAPTAGC